MRVRILLVNYEYPPLGGGGGTAMRDLAVELARRHEVMVLTSGTPELAARERLDGVEIVRIPVSGRGSHSVASFSSMAWFMWRGRHEGLRIARDFRPDVMNTWFALPTGPVGAYLSRRLQCPNLLTIIGGDIYDPSKRLSPHRWALLRGVVRGTIAAAERVCAISSDVRDRAGEYHGADATAIEVIALGLPTPQFETLDRAELGLPVDAFVIAAMGRLIARKAFDRLIEALALLQSPLAHLLIIGEGPLQSELTALATARGVSAQVHFAGRVDEDRKFQLLAASDVFAMASLHEGFGIVYLEAMHCGLPVVTSPHGGQRDFLRHEGNALLVERNQPEEFAAAWQRLLDDQALRETLGAKARQTALELSLERMSQRYEKVFEEMLVTHGH